MLLAMRTKKKIYSALFIFLMSCTIFSQDFMKIGAYSGYFSPKDAILNEVYGGKDVIVGLKIGVHLWHGFYAYLSSMQYKQVDETRLGDVTRLTLNPLSLSLRYTFSIGVANPYLESGFTQVYFSEKSDIGSTKDKGSGFSTDAGVEFRLSNRFVLDLGAQYSRVNVDSGDIEVDLGGFRVGLSFLVVF